MKETTLSIRYARALIDVLAADEHETVRRQFTTVVEMARENPDLLGFLANPFVKDGDKISVIEKIAFRAGLNEKLANFIILLVRQDRMGAIHDIYFSLDRMVTNLRPDIEAVVESPVELSAEDIENIQQRIEPLFGKAVKLNLKINTEILGGIRIKTGDKIIDATVDNSLQLIKQSIIRG